MSNSSAATLHITLSSPVMLRCSLGPIRQFHSRPGRNWKHVMAGRYEPEGPEAEFEPGSLGRVLRNRLGIKSGREIERMESEALLSATEQMNDETHIDQCFTLNYLRRMHRVWFGEIYVWAGEYRQVNMGKGSFMFAAANQVPKLMHEFGRGALRDYTPCRFEDDGELATSLAVVHGEFILIHPFREGNGRSVVDLAVEPARF